MRARHIILMIAGVFLVIALAANDLPVNPVGNNDPLIGKQAPALEVEEWINSKPLSLEDLRGKVVVLEFFQMWCPGCNKFSIPLIKRWSEKTFANNSDIVFMSVHTVFEGHSYQTTERLRQHIRDKDMRHPVAVDRHVEGQRVPVTMSRYKTGGTPCIAIVDKEGTLRFKYFGGFRPEPVEAFLRQLLEQP